MLHPKRSKFIFVYGTLRGVPPNPYSKRLKVSSTFVGMGEMEGRLFHLGTYPGALHLPNTRSTVVGEIYEILDQELIPWLDLYEGISPRDEYFRDVIPVTVEGIIIPCWSYLLRQVKSNYTLIPSGDWLVPQSLPG